MRHKNYSKLIKKLAEDKRMDDRRKSADPNFSAEENRRKNMRREEDKGIEIPQLEPRQFRALRPENFRLMSFDKIIPGSYYVSILNEHTHQPIKFGRLIISGAVAIQKQIDKYNEMNKANQPNLLENILYHIEHKNIIPVNTRMPQGKLFEFLFFKAKNAQPQEIKSFADDNEVDASELVFNKNPNSPIFAYAKYKAKIIKLASKKK